MYGLLAEGAGEFAINTDNLAEFKQALVDWVQAAFPILAGIIGAFMAFWAIKFLIRLVKRIASSAS